jgi:hypothetical protein
VSVRFEKIGTNGFRRFGRDELTIKQAVVNGGYVLRIEDEVAEASGQGGTIQVVRVSYLFIPITPQEDR